MRKVISMILALVMAFACAVAFADAIDPETIADEFGISRERVRQIQNQALVKLRTLLADESGYSTE